MDFAYRKKLDCSFDEALANVRELLSFYGFGIITEIDVKETFKNKLDVEYDNYEILGACHPDSAYNVLEANKLFGLMLPCNVIVYEEEGHVFAATVLPSEILKSASNERLKKVVELIEEKLKKVISEL